MITADRNGVELWRVFDAELKSVDHQAHGRLGRIDVFLLRDVFLQDVILQRAGNFLPVRALLFCNREIHRPDHSGGRVDGHGSGDVAQGNLVEEHFHVGQGADGHATFADFAFGERMVRVVAHQGRQIESGGEPGLTLGEQIAEAGVGVLRGAEARELAHGPQARAVHRGMNAARIRRNAGQTQVTFGIPTGQIRLAIKAANRMTGGCREIVVAFGAFLQGWLESVLLPSQFLGGGLAVWNRGFHRGEGLR